jgi:tetratricopeptide (TPR) repeat protein
LTAADRAGAEDPALLLSAGKNFRQSGDLERARATFERVVDRFPNAPESIEAAIESARTLYDGGQVGLALARAEQLVASTVGPSNQVPVLRALGGFYRELGLKGPIAETYGRVASLSDEPSVLAEAAMGLLEAGAWDEGLAVAERVEVGRLDASTAYRLLMRKGQTLLRVNPSEALDTMDRAFIEYPEQRTAAGDLNYLRANLATGRSARARILVEELYRDVEQKQSDPKRLVTAAVAYGNFLFNRGDFRAASDAYAKALYPAYLSERIEGRPIIPLDEEQHWAMYQRANALLNLSLFEDSLALYDQVATMNGPWTSEAKARASSARLELRLRGGADLRGGQAS